jgi:cytochrome c
MERRDVLCSGSTVLISLWALTALAQPPTKRFDFGRAPTEEEIRALDIDVTPDGRGLPEGSGTVKLGEAVYYAKCAFCHGVSGTEGPDDPLVGREPREGFPFGEKPRLTKTIGNYWPYATTLYDYTLRAMPFDEPGTLEPDEVYGLVAFLLFQNEIIDEDATMNRETLPKVKMPAREHFVKDDRQGGSGPLK